jgi:hypothetical protein
MKTVIETYSPDEYPKLYCSTLENYRRTQKKYAFFNNALIFIGFILLLGFLNWNLYSVDGDISQWIPWGYFMLQMSPLIWLEIRERKSFKTMREAYSKSIKTAEIRPRKLFDFISVKLLGVAIGFLILGFSSILFRYGLSSKSIENFIAIGTSNLFFVFIIYWQIYGKKMDPYQANEDRLKVIKATVISLVYMSIATNLFISIQMLTNMYQLDFLEKSMMSFYTQLIVWAGIGSKLKHLKLENINFDVYKNNKDEKMDRVETLGD